MGLKEFCVWWELCLNSGLFRSACFLMTGDCKAVEVATSARCLGANGSGTCEGDPAGRAVVLAAVPLPVTDEPGD